MFRLLACAALVLGGLVAPRGLVAEAGAQGRAGGACAAAVAKPDYGRLLKIPDTLQAEVAAYRLGWRDACAKRGVSLQALLLKGDAIAKAFADVIEKSGLKETKYEEIHELLQTAYPRFMPAFHGSMIEYEYFEPDLVVYARHAAASGDAEDKAFFASHRLLYGTDPHAFPWVNRTWDHGGCVRFGTFDWAGAVARIEDLEAKVKGEAYRRRLAELKDRISGYLTEPAAKREGKKPVVDSCASRAHTLAALDKAAKRLAVRKGWEAAAAGLRKTLDDIRANRTEICNDCLR